MPFDPDGQPVFMPFRVLLGVAENLQFEEQIFYRQHLRCFGKRQREKILNSALEGPARAGPSGLGYLLVLIQSWPLWIDCLLKVIGWEEGKKWKRPIQQ